MKAISSKLRWICAIGAMAVVMSSVVPAVAAPTAGSDEAKLEPALVGALTLGNNQSKYDVIITRGATADLGKRLQKKRQVEDEVRAEGGDVRASLDIIGGHHAVLPGKAVRNLIKNKNVKSISLNHRVSTLAATTTVSSLIQSTQTVTANAPQVWNTYGQQGQGVTVAVLDSGIKPSQDLSNVTFGADKATGTSVLNDLGGHGTHVAGIIAGNGSMSAGAYEGIAPNARVLMVKVTTDDGHASYASIISGIMWVVAHQRAYNIKVANLSLGATPVSGYADDPLDAAVEVAWFRGITVVASAGNSGPGPSTIVAPGNDPYIISVGAFDDNQTSATTLDDAIPDWTSRGPTAFDGVAKPDLVASGRRIVSLRVVGSFLDLLMPDRVTAVNYFRLSGTSMAAPVVSGVAALLMGQKPNLTPNQVKYILKTSARPLAYSANTVGAGAVNALAAMQLAVAGVNDAKANKDQKPNRKTATALWPVVKTMSPIWRHKGLYNGRMWVDGSWDASGFKLQDGSWDDGSWDDGAWDNFSWEDGSWDDGSWDDGSWDDGSWDTIQWNASQWDTADLGAIVP